MSGPTCTAAEIENKRRLALQRRQTVTQSSSSPIAPKTSDSFFKSSPTLDSSSSKYPYPKKRRKFEGQVQYTPPKRNISRHAQIANTFYGQLPSTSSVTGSCYMISKDRLAIELSVFHHQSIDTFRSIPSAAYDATTRIWNFSIKHYELLKSKMMQLKPTVVINWIPKNVVQAFERKDFEDLDSIDLSRIEQTLLDTLMPFQKEGIAFGVSKNGRCMIADDMGLGKTLQALGIADYYREQWPLLIVCPSSMRFQWSDTIYQYLPSLPLQDVQHFESSKDYVNDCRILITSYDVLWRSIDTIEKHIFGVVILDESHLVKNLKTQRMQAVKRMIDQARRVILLSGTPALSRPIELFTQISLIKPNFMQFHDYGIRYCAGFKNTFVWDYSGSSNMQELQLLLKQLCMIRRLKSDIPSQLPGKSREVVVLDPALIKASTKEMEAMRKNISVNLNNEGVPKHATVLAYFNETASAKLKAICNYVSDLLESDRKFLIFAYHRTVMDGLCDLLRSKKVKYILIDGRTHANNRKERVDAFQEKDEYQVAVLSIVAANAGITLTSAQLVIFAELFWNPSVLLQAEDRVHRIGQTSQVVVRYLIAKKTIDDFLWNLLESKREVLKSAGLTQDFSLTNSTMTVHESRNQSKIDSFVKVNKSPGSSAPKRDSDADSSMDISTNNVKMTEEYKDLLDIDDDDFNAIDLDMIA